MDWSDFTLESLIVHDVPRRLAAGGGGEIVYSDVPSSLTQPLKNFFTERIQRSLQEGYQVKRRPGTESPIPAAVARATSDPGSFVEQSKLIAEHLHRSQSGSNPAGLLVISLGEVNDQAGLSILKLDREDAVRLRRTADDEGLETFDVEHLHDLMLGKNTRVFKASTFVAPTGEESLDGLVSDNQRPYFSATHVATFFLETFLGCELKSSPSVSTQKFFTSAQNWITGFDDPEKRGKYEIALLADLNSTTSIVNPVLFANNYLEASDRASFRDQLQNDEIDLAPFPKDTALVASQIKRLSVTFEDSTLRVVGSADDVAEQVTINPTESEVAVEIRAPVKDIRGGR